MADIDYTNLRLSLKNLEKQFAHYQSMDDSFPQWIQEGIPESVIQRFEIHYDCLLKVLSKHLHEKIGVAEVPKGARPLFRLAGENDLLDCPVDQWFGYVEMRNRTTHAYSGEMIKNFLKSMDGFIEDAINLYQTMTGENWE